MKTMLFLFWTSSAFTAGLSGAQAAELEVEVGNGIVIIGVPGEPGQVNKILKPGELDAMIWSSGPNTTDQTIHDRQESLEKKFGIDKDGQPVGRVFDKFPVNGGPDNDGPGKYGSKTQTDGGGRSTVNGNKKLIIMNLSATGVLGDPPQKGDKEVQADYQALASFLDPNFIYREDLADSGLVKGMYGLYQTFGITSLSMPLGVDTTLGSPTAEVFVNVTTDTFSGNLLELSFDSLGATDWASATSARFFRHDDLNDAPSFDPARLRTAEQISDTIAADLFADGFLDAPLYYGAYIPSSLSFDPAHTSPTLGTMGVGGSVMEPASKIGYVPLPAGFPLLLLGLGGLFVLRRRAVKSTSGT